MYVYRNNNELKFKFELFPLTIAYSTHSYMLNSD